MRVADGDGDADALLLAHANVFNKYGRHAVDHSQRVAQHFALKCVVVLCSDFSCETCPLAGCCSGRAILRHEIFPVPTARPVARVLRRSRRLRLAVSLVVADGLKLRDRLPKLLDERERNIVSDVVGIRDIVSDIVGYWQRLEHVLRYRQ